MLVARDITQRLLVLLLFTFLLTHPLDQWALVPHDNHVNWDGERRQPTAKPGYIGAIIVGDVIPRQLGLCSAEQNNFRHVQNVIPDNGVQRPIGLPTPPPPSTIPLCGTQYRNRS